MQGHTLPVVVCELAAFDIWHRDDTTAFVLAIPNGAGNLQHSQNSAVPAQEREHSEPPPRVHFTALPDGDTSCIHLLIQIMTHFPSKLKSSLQSLLPFLYVCVKLWETSEGDEEMKSGDFKAVYCHPVKSCLA